MSWRCEPVKCDIEQYGYSEVWNDLNIFLKIEYAQKPITFFIVRIFFVHKYIL